MSEFIESRHFRPQAEAPTLARLGAITRQAAVRAWVHIEQMMPAQPTDSAPHRRRVTRSFVPQIGTSFAMPPDNVSAFSSLQADEVLLVDPVVDDPEAV